MAKSNLFVSILLMSMSGAFSRFDDAELRVTFANKVNEVLTREISFQCKADLKVYIRALSRGEEEDAWALRNTRMVTPDGKIGISLAKCAPHSCSVADMNQIYSHLDLVFYENLCQTKSSKVELDAGSIATISFLGLILLIVVVSTAYDAILYNLNKKPSCTIFIAFSVITNGKKLITTSNGPNQISCLHGIRVISTMWVILGHRYSVQNLFPSTNYLEIVKWMTNPANMYITQAKLPVDTFFVLGGLVVAYICMSATTNGSKLNIIMYYIHRYLRLTPVLAVVMLIHVTLLRHLGSGALWSYSVERDLVRPCERYWWKALLYIQNYGRQESYCVPQAWYLSVDTQLFVLSPILLIPLRKWPLPTLSATGFLTACSVIACFLSGWFFQLRHSVMGTSDDIEKVQDYLDYYYIALHTRAAPWFIGFILGYVIFRIKQRKTTLVFNKVVILLLWLISLAPLLTCVFIGHGLIFGEYNRIANSFHLALVRPCWAVALSFIIFACVTGYGGPINWFLSVPLFQVVSKLTYTLYISHFIAIYISTDQMRITPRFSDGEMLYKVWGDFALTMAFATVLTLAFESPIVTIEKVLFDGIRTKAIKQSPSKKQEVNALPSVEA